MYLSIGGDMSVRASTIIGVFDLDATTVSPRAREYLEKMEQAGTLISATDDLPKAFLVTEEFGLERVYFTQLSAATIERRLHDQT